MLHRWSNKRSDERGITGLETAIILIAFVVVAAVFAYTALSAGLFSSQKSKEAIYSGLEEAQSTIEVKGGVVAIANSTGANGDIKQLTLTLALASSGEPVDFTNPTGSGSDDGKAASGTGSSHKVVISYVDADQRVDDLYWTTTELGTGNGNKILEQNEKFQLTIGATTKGASGGNLCDALSTALSSNKQFSIEIKPASGATLVIERTTPAFIDNMMNLN